MNHKSGLRIIGALLGLLLSGGATQAHAGDVQTGFPEYAEVEFEHSIITIPIILKGETVPAEVLKVDAFMRLNREKPARNGLGYRQFEFIIDAWELYGYSKVLDAYITIKLSETIKPKSLGVSLQKDKDYPAMIVYNAIYDIYVNEVRVGQGRAGVAFATGVMEIPPRNITVAFHKPYSFSRTGGSVPDGSICVTEPCPCSGNFCFGDGTCEDMEQIPEATFNEGVAKAASYRVAAALQPKTPPPAPTKKKGN
ncbi:hypothetical protein [Pyxidicoccus sp. MSG2]|uniref:hypothetical protein n=1 Tax=Pyxidicoccus sp. MSG2 TaxID=2996790 RepID=UPI002271F0DA|nr:hypothetical protein [Pyxidicoccus sp. MSG2]MCY1021115.1 hypothetical protein [Pyxidicoccus sp. MSG2]